MENGPGLSRCISLLNMGIFQPAMLVYQRVIKVSKHDPLVSKVFFLNDHPEPWWNDPIWPASFWDWGLKRHQVENHLTIWKQEIPTDFWISNQKTNQFPRLRNKRVKAPEWPPLASCGPPEMLRFSKFQNLSDQTEGKWTMKKGTFVVVV